MNQFFTHDQFMHHLENNFPWAPILKITNVCDYRCAHCCECSGPDERPDFMPTDDISEILGQFKTVRNSMRVATITGGEPMTAYKLKSPFYIPKLLKTCAAAGYSVELKTNCGWTLGDNSDKIFNDLEQFFVKYPRIFCAYHISLDKFHKNANDTTVEFLKWYCTNDNLSPNACVHMFYDDLERMTNAMVDLKRKYNIAIDFKHPAINPITNEKIDNSQYNLWFFEKSGRNEKFMFWRPYSGIENAGRAKNTVATIPTPSLSRIINNRSNCAIMFDHASGRVQLFACGNDGGISVPYKNNRGKIIAIDKLKKQLFQLAYQKYVMEQNMRY